MTTPTTPLPVVNPLVETLDQECEALSLLNEALADQLAALRERDNERLGAAADRTSEAAADLGRLRLARERQSRLAARVLGVDLPENGSLEELNAVLRARDPEGAERLERVRMAVRAAAERADDQSHQVAFALHVAVDVGRDLLRAWQDLETPAPAPTYTAAGQTAAAPRRSLVNHVG